MPQRIQRRRTKGWKTPLCSCGCGRPARYVGRPTVFGNPAIVGERMTFWAPTRDLVSGRRDSYRTTIRVASRIHATSIFRALLTSPWCYMDAWGLPTGWQDELRGHDLACWCPLPEPGKPDHCHAAVLLELANGGDR